MFVLIAYIWKLKKKSDAFKPDLNERNPNEVGVQFSSVRTGLAFQRTRLSADRNLMAVIRTSLSLIGFGFTAFQFFEHLHHQISGHIRNNNIKIFAIALVGLGILMLILGIVYQLSLMIQIRKERDKFMKEGLLPSIDKYPISMTLIVALMLLIIGVISIAAMLIQLNLD